MVETAVGFVLGAVIGAIATAAGSYLLYWKRERDATRRLRQAFRQELRAYEHVDEIVDDGGYERVTTSVETPVIYESAAGDLGLLTESEIGKLVAFYSSLYWLRGLEDPEDKKERIESVVEKRRAALEALDGANGTYQ
ncbi:hypothetical protein HALLA_05095 [Halostagnicola larsenii XH-48]|uniref:Uncharacterized protein n=1 Tax=Halostagnicola larsenii XH-48 TaxID=797299 RepID=W0JM37_9EURY|nr:hypothetical protein [Halostagnicola larsenii]AHF98346.1 hypothetical protein HALLA_05095 [Halostagnicola larsenii XH-48]